jgi:hypothetical protein
MDTYAKTVDRLEPDIAMIDTGAFNASAAISLKRIADCLEWLVKEAQKQIDDGK